MTEIILQTRKVLAAEDGTRKFLFELGDGNRIETVFMQHPYGGSVCVTSQAGCSMGCVFCASGLQKKIRNLLPEEMLEQVFSVQRILKEQNLTHVVVMGTGEPFDNFENVMDFCDKITSQPFLDQYFKVNTFPGRTPEDSFSALAPRRITVSTCGLIPQIYAFAETPKRYNLAISLHAPEDELRGRLMPVNRKYRMEELIRAASDYCEKTRRRVTFEYILLRGINDSDAHAASLARILSGQEGFYVNLIPYNPVEGLPFQGTEKNRTLAFYDVLMKQGIRATLRKERGTDIAAACGQLKALYGRSGKEAGSGTAASSI